MKSYDEMLEEFLATKQVTKCPDAYKCSIEHEFNITASPKERRRKKNRSEKDKLRNEKFFDARYQ